MSMRHDNYKGSKKPWDQLTDQQKQKRRQFMIRKKQRINSQSYQNQLKNYKNSKQFKLITQVDQNKIRKGNVTKSLIKIDSNKQYQQFVRSNIPEKIFIDNSFKPGYHSLAGQYQIRSDWNYITWVKATQTIKDYAIFKNMPDPTDIKQGALADCYFLAGLAALAQKPHRILNIFITKQIDQYKHVAVKILYSGKWIVINMDQYLPWYINKSPFGKTDDNQLWVVFLQKAWAKLYTSYMRIQGGQAQQAIHDLTGAPIHTAYFQLPSFKQREEWKYLLQASKLQYSMVCSSLLKEDGKESNDGIVLGHAYTFLQALQIKDVNGKIIELCKLRNPWGYGQWKGQFSDFDSNWDRISQQQKKRIGYQPNLQDGIFFIPYKNFIKQCSSITVAEINDQSSYNYLTYYSDRQQSAFFIVDIVKQDKYSFMIDKTPQRMYSKYGQKYYQQPSTLIQISKIQNNKIVKKFVGLRSTRRTVSKTQKLLPGRYIVHVLIKCSDYLKIHRKYQTNLATYSVTPTIIRLATKQQSKIFQESSNNTIIGTWIGQNRIKQNQSISDKKIQNTKVDKEIQ